MAADLRISIVHRVSIALTTRSASTAEGRPLACPRCEDWAKGMQLVTSSHVV